MLTDPEARRRFGAGWADEARRMVAQFRTTHDLWAGRSGLRSNCWSRVRQGSTEFAEWWDAHDIRNVALGQKVLYHPVKGPQRFEYATFQANDDPGLKLAIYTPV